MKKLNFPINSPKIKRKIWIIHLLSAIFRNAKGLYFSPRTPYMALIFALKTDNSLCCISLKFNAVLLKIYLLYDNILEIYEFSLSLNANAGVYTNLIDTHIII
jgi:hypothetical protein